MRFWPVTLTPAVDMLPSILLVEDDALIAMMVADMCDALGYGEPVQAAAISEALAAIEGQDITGALLDVHLGADAVWPVADALAARGVPFAFMTGGGGDVPSAHAARPTLAKPFRVAELDSLLGALLRHDA
jgi:DNA-binding response OmpR family regulator